MELPHIGEHCCQPDCNKLDYLPILCNLCSKKFCNEHHRYEDHSCPERHKVDIQVPICPLCEKPVPSKSGLAPDLAVNEHLENNCQSRSKKVYRIRCSVSGCKVKELVSIQCESCKLNFCLRHRHAADHECKGPVSARRELTLNGSIFKNWISGKSSASTNTKRVENSAAKNIHPSSNGIVKVAPTVRDANVSIFQGNIGEEEAIRKAILVSQGDTLEEENSTALSEDEQLARALQLSLQEQNQTSTNANLRNSLKVSDCSVS